MANVVIYTTPTCGYCKQAKAYFEENNVQYKEVDVSVDQEAAQEMMQKSGQLGTPVITVDDAVVIGFDQRKLAQLLELGK